MNSGNFQEVLQALKDEAERPAREAAEAAEKAERERIAREPKILHDSGFMAEYEKETSRFERKARRRAERRERRQMAEDLGIDL